MDPVRILITGRDGQLGQALQEACFQNPDVHANFIDRQELDLCGYPEEIRKGLRKFRFDAIINCAAYTDVNGAENGEGKNLADRINRRAVIGMAKACNDLGARLVQISTDYVFGSPPSDGQAHRTSDHTVPVSAYGWTKLKGEYAALAAGLATIVRTSWLYGRRSSGLQGSQGLNFVQKVLKAGLSPEQTTLFGVVDEQGLPTFAGDLADFLLTLVLDRHPLDLPEVIHFCNSGSKISRRDFVQAILEAAMIEKEVVPITREEFRSKYGGAERSSDGTLDLSETFEIIGCAPPNWKESLTRYVSEQVKEWTQGG